MQEYLVLVLMSTDFVRHKSVSDDDSVECCWVPS